MQVDVSSSVYPEASWRVQQTQTHDKQTHAHGCDIRSHTDDSYRFNPTDRMVGMLPFWCHLVPGGKARSMKELRAKTLDKQTRDVFRGRARGDSDSVAG